jgi:predicted restriction endonuclease
VLEAAHIVPYQGSTTNHVENGLLLRADLHTLFDLEYLAVDPSTLTIAVSPQMSGTEYAALDGQRLHLHDRARGPSRDALAYRFARFQRSLTR